MAAIQHGMQSPDPTPGVDSLTLVSPSVAADPDYRAWWDNAGRRAASPAAAASAASRRSPTSTSGISCHRSRRRAWSSYDRGYPPTTLATASSSPSTSADVTVARQHDINEPWWIGDTNFILTNFERFLAATTH